MKLQVSKFFIETDYIEMIERLSDHTVKLYFVFGEILDVVCRIKQLPLDCEKGGDFLT